MALIPSILASCAFLTDARPAPLPPIGMVLYVLSSVSKVPFEKIVRAVLPYLGVLLIVLLMITFIPGLVTFLPNLVL